MTSYSPEPFSLDEVKQASQFTLPKLPRCFRIVLAMVGIGLLSLLATARVLEPSPSGKGTHQQLGFPPCSFELWFDSRCPSCGMTTSWSHMVRGQIVESFNANCGGALLAIVSLLMIPWMLATAYLGRWLIQPPNDKTILIIAVSIMLVTLVDWAVRVFA